MVDPLKLSNSVKLETHHLDRLEVLSLSLSSLFRQWLPRFSSTKRLWFFFYYTLVSCILFTFIAFLPVLPSHETLISTREAWKVPTEEDERTVSLVNANVHSTEILCTFVSVQTFNTLWYDCSVQSKKNPRLSLTPVLFFRRKRLFSSFYTSLLPVSSLEAICLCVYFSSWHGCHRRFPLTSSVVSLLFLSVSVDKPLRFVRHRSICFIQCPLGSQHEKRDYEGQQGRGLKRTRCSWVLREARYSIIFMTASGDFYVARGQKEIRSWWTASYLKREAWGEKLCWTTRHTCLL